MTQPVPTNTATIIIIITRPPNLPDAGPDEQYGPYTRDNAVKFLQNLSTFTPA